MDALQAELERLRDWQARVVSNAPWDFCAVESCRELLHIFTECEKCGDYFCEDHTDKARILNCLELDERLLLLRKTDEKRICYRCVSAELACRVCGKFIEEVVILCPGRGCKYVCCSRACLKTHDDDEIRKNNKQ
jgi:hypothetical protein